MRVIVHDFGAYAFPVQLSRELAQRGHDILHLFSDFVPRKGRLWVESEDPENLTIKPVSIGQERQKYSYIKRWKQERAYGHAVAAEAEKFQADIVFSCNTPLDASNILLEACKTINVPYVHWTQDIHSLAISAVLNRKLPIIGALVSNYYLQLERRIIGKAAATIVISDDFNTEFNRLKIHPIRTYVIPNWMPLDEMMPGTKQNDWAERHELQDTFNIIYVGTLSFKHNEALFIEMSKRFASDPQVRIVVVSAGIVFDKLKEQKQLNNLTNLVLLGWQDYRDISKIFASGDILMAMVNPDASAFSVPCKVLSYLCAGRPVLAAIPEENLIAKILKNENMGLIASPQDPISVIQAAQTMKSDAELMNTMSQKGRNYAIRTFDIKKITNEFEAIMEKLS